MGDWKLYFNPHKQRGKQDKWRRKFAGPYLVVDVPGPVNVTLQLNAKAKPFLAHTDKVKRYCTDVMPKSWPKSGDSITEGPSSNADPEVSINTVPDEVCEIGTLPSDGPSILLHDRESAESEGGQVVSEWAPPVVYHSPRSHRARQLPARYRD